MGQRSQIYVKYNNSLIVANYYSWNYAERMVSRARHGIEYIKQMIDDDFMFMFKQQSYIEKLRRYFDVNFDMQDIIISSNIMEDYKEYSEFGYDYDDFVYKMQDNNDGKLFIHIIDGLPLRHAFTDGDIKRIMNPSQYMQWDMENWQDKLPSEECKTCRKNIFYIMSNAELMTMEELTGDFIVGIPWN